MKMRVWQIEVNPESWTKNFQGLFMLRHHTLKEKKEIIRLHETGARAGTFI